MTGTPIHSLLKGVEGENQQHSLNPILSLPLKVISETWYARMGFIQSSSSLKPVCNTILFSFIFFPLGASEQCCNDLLKTCLATILP